MTGDAEQPLDRSKKLADDLRVFKPLRAHAMSKRPNKAKSIVAQPLFRSRQERPAKGKGSYRREAFQSRDREAFYFLAA